MKTSIFAFTRQGWVGAIDPIARGRLGIGGGSVNRPYLFGNYSLAKSAAVRHKGPI
jgi:hypothetical protein